jgi:hypothetical protein
VVAILAASAHLLLVTQESFWKGSDIDQIRLTIAFILFHASLSSTLLLVIWWAGLRCSTQSGLLLLTGMLAATWPLAVNLLINGFNPDF